MNTIKTIKSIRTPLGAMALVVFALLLVGMIGAREQVMAQPADGTAPATTPAPRPGTTPSDANSEAAPVPGAEPSTAAKPVAPVNQTDAPLTAAQIAELDACRALANNSGRLRGQLKNDLRPEIQEEDAEMTVRNKRHVIMAYAALWILAVGFLVLLFVRQRRLLAEIDQLRKEVADAASD